MSGMENFWLVFSWAAVGACIFMWLLPLKPLAEINLWRALLISVPLGPAAFLCAAVFLLVRCVASLEIKLQFSGSVREWLTK